MATTPTERNGHGRMRTVSLLVMSLFDFTMSRECGYIDFVAALTYNEVYDTLWLNGCTSLFLNLYIHLYLIVLYLVFKIVESLWKDRSIPVALKMRLVKTLVWTVLSYGAEAWTLKVRDERKITSMEM